MIRPFVFSPHPSAARLSATGTMLALAVFLLYLPGLSGPFVLDDFLNIVSNHGLRINALSLDSLWQAAFSRASGPLQRPVAMVSFALNYRFGELDPFGYKLINVLLHLMTACALFFVSAALLKRLQAIRPGDLGPLSPRSAAAIIALLWAVHPLHASTTLYVVQRMTILSALFSLLAALAYLSGREAMQRGALRRGWLTIAGGCLGFGALGAFSKENALLLPLLLLLIETVFYRESWKTSLSARWLATLLAVPSLGILGYLIYAAGLPAPDFRGFTTMQRLMTESGILLDYAGQILLPRPGSMSMYEVDVISTTLWQPPSTLFATACIVVVLAAALTLAVRQRQPVLAFGVLWFLAGHLLESTVLALELRFEHRNYLPSFGLLFAAVLMLGRLPMPRNLQLGLLAAALLYLADGLHARAVTWSSPTAFLNHELKVNPQSPRAWNDLAYFLRLSGKPEDALPHLARAARLAPREVGYPLILLDMQLHELQQPSDPALPREILNRLEKYPLTPFGQNCVMTFAHHVLTMNPGPASLKTSLPILKAAVQKALPHGKVNPQIVARIEALERSTAPALPAK